VLGESPPSSAAEPLLPPRHAADPVPLDADYVLLRPVAAEDDDGRHPAAPCPPPPVVRHQSAARFSPCNIDACIEEESESQVAEYDC